MKFLLILLFLFTNVIFSQNTFKGYLKDSNDKLAISGANIFVANTSIATISDENGFFEITVNNSNTDILISFVGYETISVSIKSLKDFQIVKNIFLNKTNISLDEVAINFRNVKNRSQALKTFTRYFVGYSEIASKVEIENPDDIQFREEKLSNNYKLIAFSDKPIILVNKRLGYKISYILMDFEYNHDSNHENFYALYKGYAQFIDIVKQFDLNEKKTIYNRANAYNGSAMHFIRSIYNNSYETEGFKITKFKKVVNPLYQKKDALNSILFIDNIEHKFKIIHSNLQPNESLLIEESGIKHLTFPDYLLVSYKNEKEDYNYVSDGYDRKNYQNSELQLKDLKITIFPDGNYSPDDKLVFFGHMALEKMGDMLPFDYQP